MSARGTTAVAMVLIGLFLMTMSYFQWAAPWGFPPSDESYSNPRAAYAPAIFILGVMMAFLAAVVYELLPEKEPKGRA